MRERYEAFGVWLTEVMRAHENMSGAELGRRLETNKSSASHWKAGDERPECEMVIRIADLFGYDRIELLKLTRHWPGEPQPQPDPYRRVKHEQVDAWLTAVGPDYEGLFWESLTAHAQATAELIARVRTAVSATLDAAVSASIPPTGPHTPRRKRRRQNGNSTLAASQRPRLTHAALAA